MNERELKVIRQRIAARLETREDAQALADEASRLRRGIRDVIEAALLLQGKSGCEGESCPAPVLVRSLHSLLG